MGRRSNRRMYQSIGFGKYKNTPIERVLKKDPQYLKWALSNTDLSIWASPSELKEMPTWLKIHIEIDMMSPF